MGDKGEIFYLRKDMNYMKHQLSCVMQALKITPCACHECIVTPTLIGSTNEEIVGFVLDSSKNTFNGSPSTTSTITTPPSSRDDSVPKREQHQQNINLFDDILKINGVSCSNPEENELNSASYSSTEHNYVCASNEHNYGKAKPTDPTAQCVPTNIVSLKDVPKTTAPIRVCSPRKKKLDTSASKEGVNVKEEPNAYEETKKISDPKPKLSPKRRGRKRRLAENVDPSGTPVKLDKIGRRFYSKEQKKAIYDTYLEKGLYGAAKDFGTTMTAIYNQVHRYKVTMYSEEAKKSFAKRLRTTSVTKATQNVRTQRQRRPTAKVEENEEIENTLAEQDVKPVRQTAGPKRSKKIQHIGGRRIYSPEIKKSIFKYFFTYGRHATMKHFKMTPGIFTYLMYSKCHYQLRQSVKAALKKNETLKENDRNGAESEREENQLIETTDSTLKKEQIKNDWSNGIAVTEESERDTSNAQQDLITPKKEEDVETDQDNSVDYETENSTAGSVDGRNLKGHRGGRQKILTDEQEQQLYQVLRTLEQQGTKITPNLLSYAAKQIIKRAADVDPNNIKISYSYAIVSLRKYRELKD